MATSERSPPERSDRRRTFRPAGRTSTSTPVSSRRSGSVNDSRPVPPGNSVDTSSPKWWLTSAKAASNARMISSSSVRMTCWSSRRARRTSSTWPSRKVWRSVRPDSSSSASGFTGPSRSSSACRCSTRADTVTPPSSAGTGSARASSALAPSSLPRVSTTDSRRTADSASSSSTLWRRLRLAASSCSAPARRRRSSSRRAPPARTASIWRRCSSRWAARMVSTRPRTRSTDSARPSMARASRSRRLRLASAWRRSSAWPARRRSISVSRSSRTRRRSSSAATPTSKAVRRDVAAASASSRVRLAARAERCASCSSSRAAARPGSRASSSASRAPSRSIR